ncbi:Glycosyl transferase 11 [Halocaridina rubra]|uniref:L-Fucosyltransferase n=1 Tax=Halocaridina rubra TaxID=373956 RepID=A0AAN8WK58_HALRR
MEKQQYDSKLPEYPYFHKAISYYRNKFPKPLFVIASDDRTYIENTFGKIKDIVFAPGKSKEQDLAILASCDHSIISVGSFGFWAGYLTGGEVVYPDIYVNSVYPFSRPIYELSQLDFFTPLPVS